MEKLNYKSEDSQNAVNAQQAVAMNLLSNQVSFLISPNIEGYAFQPAKPATPAQPSTLVTVDVELEWEPVSAQPNCWEGRTNCFNVFVDKSKYTIFFYGKVPVKTGNFSKSDNLEQRLAIAQKAIINFVANI